MNTDKLLGYGIIFLLFLFVCLAIAFVLRFIVTSGMFLLSIIITSKALYNIFNIKINEYRRNKATY